MIARVVAQEISGPLGQNVIVENVGGAAGALGTRQVAKAEPDGHVITFGNNQTHGNNMFMLKDPGYDAVKDFAPLAGVGAFEHVFVTKKDLPVKGIQDVIALAKAKPTSSTTAPPASARARICPPSCSWPAQASR